MIKITAIKYGVTAAIILIILLVSNNKVKIVRTTMMMLPTIGEIPNICSNVDPEPANITTATPNKKKVMTKSRIGPIYLPPM